MHRTRKRVMSHGTGLELKPGASRGQLRQTEEFETSSFDNFSIVPAILSAR